VKGKHEVKDLDYVIFLWKTFRDP